ncbi:MAG: cob(I)yrinic acid a,c-diamide adenosyltransferase [Gemmatimonadales bacterium]|nr:cob(I)yrinic acid a,c-diamide adenosyltransferase [Gemmatimonadales bacterium]NIN12979.1 cob(I)yrinic acid a,c-diamide adenosyltransferase [Gemmatimonadales bacterium]NIN51056.1 cob(I)yrinic acid a,c-diamide adenosyltransferase [Gemmatimonadales bacterium]NIP08520.1 cob(I)yrinic acid a,c-diamide adenosyltransferase [Gemmatimonadales bacterium]NIR02238.1 cob(I)yrinic acid a,c-diamide adenosyltransferase [Gemmatimonadales bacterium]
MKRGYVQVYTGNGKGKTTAALGLALRAAGHGLNTYVGQFMKGQPYGELGALSSHPHITIEQYGEPQCTTPDDVTPEQVAQAQHGLTKARAAMLSGHYDIIVLDEINVTVWFRLLTAKEVVDFLEARPPHIELILTGRNAPAVLIDRADLVTEMKPIKHYYDLGITARPGIEH